MFGWNCKHNALVDTGCLNYSKMLCTLREDHSTMFIVHTVFRLETVVEPWMDSLWPTLHRFFHIPSGGHCNAVDQSLGGADSHLPPGGDTTGANNADAIVNRDDAKESGVITKIANIEVKDSSLTKTNRSSAFESSMDVGGTALSCVDDKNCAENIRRKDVSDPAVVTCSNSLSIEGSSGVSDSVEESLLFSLPPLCESSLTLPACPLPYLEIQYHPTEELVRTASYVAAISVCYFYLEKFGDGTVKFNLWSLC